MFAWLPIVAALAAEFSVVGYLPEWRYLQWTPEEQEYRWHALSRHISHLIIFSIEVSPDGSLAAMDRFPPDNVLKHAHAASQDSMKLMICFGGNSRTNGFPQMVSSRGTRRRFLSNLAKLIKEKGLHGVDYNWEYPNSQRDWEGLAALVRETRKALPDCVITIAYYPDGHQEARIAELGIHDNVDYLLMMSYDQPKKHSTVGFMKESIVRGLRRLPAAKMAVGVPFYSRNVHTGDWKTYEDIVNRHGPLDEEVDQVGDDYFNGLQTIMHKVRYAKERGMGGVMIWEVGQDAFSNKDKDLRKPSSLLLGISRALADTEEL